MNTGAAGFAGKIGSRPPTPSAASSTGTACTCARNLAISIRACWEVDDNGIKTDPWQRVVYLVMRNMENDEIVTFTST